MSKKSIGKLRATKPLERKLPAHGAVKRYIITSAQSDTKLFDAGWETLMTAVRHYDAELLVSRYTYEHTNHHFLLSKPGSRDTRRGDPWYDHRIWPYICDRRVNLAPGLTFCGELNILPTAARPLSGLESYTGRWSCIVPHAKTAMVSVPSGKTEGTKLMYTTGTMTLRNYLQRKAGQKAEFHHSYGALLVEIDHNGNWWCRQLLSDSEGVIYDLDTMFDGNRVVEGVSVEAITWGDIHVGQMDEANAKACWYRGGLLDQLKPKYQFMHDVLDFHSRNHHERDNPHKRFERYIRGQFRVEIELSRVKDFLKFVKRPGCKTVIISSNHHDAFERWLREGDYKRDEPNALLFLAAQLAKYTAIAKGEKEFSVFKWAMRRAGITKEIATFLAQDQSFVICHDANGGIECGMHGHLGPNGQRGSANAFARMGRKAVVGHSHTAGIVDGIYVAGTSSKLDLGYNAGPSSWTHSHVLTYRNGKRAILTIWNGKAYAQQVVGSASGITRIPRGSQG